MHTHQLPNHISNFRLETGLIARIFTLLVLLDPTSLIAQIQLPQVEVIELSDSRGEVVIDKLTIGRSLSVRLDHAIPGANYRFALTTSNEREVDQVVVTANATGLAETNQLFYKSHIWAEGCQPSGGGPFPPGGSGDILGPYNSVSEASAELDGMTLWFTADVEIADPAGGPGYWSRLTVQQITMKAPEQAIYYWSNEYGYEDCFARTGEEIYLSVYKGHLEPFHQSRVFMIQRPDDKQAWNNWDGDPMTAPAFFEVRHKPNCEVTPDETCFYEDGSFSTLPDTVTIPIEGLLPAYGQFLAVIRPVDDEGLFNQGWTRYFCDRATEGTLSINVAPHATDSQDGWGCPPCPN